MSRTTLRAALVTAAIYGYFLIFAQFAFVELVRGDYARAGSSSAGPEKVILGLMALAGIASGFFVAWRGASPWKVRIGLIIAAVAAAVAPLAQGTAALIAVAILTGAAIGLSTVSLATLIRSWCGLVWVGIGTGIGYACCNLPPVFLQSPAHQAWIACGFALLGAMVVPSSGVMVPEAAPRVFPFPATLVLFTALVWLDSAAFFIIQHAVDLKSGTWGDASLWRNAAIHLGAAAAAGIWLRSHGGARLLPAIAWVMLAAAAIAVNDESLRTAAGWLYPAAVSLYSAALVSWPGWFCGVSGDRAVRWRAAWLYAVAGWFGSANGIGMAQSLERVPQGFIVISGACVVGVMLVSNRKNWRVAFAVVGVFTIALWPREKAASPAGDAYERGKQVYLSEGCIHCHSQYVRPGTRDGEYWGPALVGSEKVKSWPVMIGNRRQGPDLANIGARRSTVWLTQHFIDPRAFSPGSPMPSYAHLFEDGRGQDLVSYLQKSGEKQMSAMMEKTTAWKPFGSATATRDGRALFASQCAVCHGPDGTGNGWMASDLTRPPANLVAGPFVWSPAAPDRALKIQRIIKYGIAGTDMPGHETLTDGQLLALERYVSELRKE